MNRLRRGVYEVMFSEWDACRREGGCSHNPKDLGWGRAGRPAIRVNWKDAQQYIGWLSTKTGRRYRLLSESEWEYATRRHSENSVRRNRENCLACGMDRWDNEKSSPVGSFAANPLGLYDVRGNVWEWVQDCWRSNYREFPADGSAWTRGDEEDCSRRVVRGGLCCAYSPSDLRSGKRQWDSLPKPTRLHRFPSRQDVGLRYFGRTASKTTFVPAVE